MKRIAQYPKQFIERAQGNEWRIGPNGFILITLASFFVGGLYGYTMAGVLTGIFLGGFLAYVVPAQWLEQVEKKNSKDRRKVLVDAMRAVQNAYLATDSFVSAIQVSLPLMQEPAASAFRQVLISERTGLPLSEAMQHVKKAFPYPEVDTFIQCVDVMQEAGGQHATLVIDRFISQIEDTLSREETIETELAGRNTEVRQLFILFLVEMGVLKLFEVLNPDLVVWDFSLDLIVAALLGINIAMWLFYKRAVQNVKKQII